MKMQLQDNYFFIFFDFETPPKGSKRFISRRTSHFFAFFLGDAAEDSAAAFVFFSRVQAAAA